MSGRNEDFDFEKFAVSMIKTIDSLRSKGKSGSEDKIESRINAFYRALGLPAVMISSGYGIPDKFNNGNLFPEEKLKPDNKLKADLLKREAAQFKPINVDLAKNFLDYSEPNLLGNLQEVQGYARESGVLFPMIVNAGIPIYPQRRRVGRAFSTDEELTQDDIQYKRPFIEAIISMRLKADGILDSTKQSPINSALSASISRVSKQLPIVLHSSLTNGIEIFNTVIEIMGRVRTKISTKIIPQKSNIAQENPNKESGSGAQLEVERQYQEQVRTIKQSIAAIFDYQGSRSKDKEQNIQNLRDITFMNELYNAAVFDEDGATQKSRDDTEEKIQKYEADLERAYRGLELVLGTFSGISGIDILAIITAMLEIELDVLISMLSPSAIDNLNNQYNLNQSPKYGAREAVTKLQNKVEELIRELYEGTTQRKHNNKRSNKRVPNKNGV